MNIEDLGRRAVACKHWRWMNGMRIVHTSAQAGRGKPVAARLCSLGYDDAFVMESRNAGTIPQPFAGDDHWVPDLTDPATLGCMLHLVREATGQQSSPSWYPGGNHDYPHWAWYSDNCYGKLCEGATEAECLVRVLEFTP